MAEVERESKTEEPTERKIADAIERGQVPRSREMSVFASLLGILIVLSFLIGPKMLPFASDLAAMIDHPAAFSLASGEDATQLLFAAAISAGAFLLPIVVVLGVAGFAASFFQHAPSFALEQIRPRWSRISPAAGWKRLFGAAGAAEFAKSLFKFGAIAVVVSIVLIGDRGALLDALYTEPRRLPEMMLSRSAGLVSAACVTLVLLVAADVVFSRLRWRADLRMTRQELKDEIKQSEGDPLVKSRLRSLARDRARRRMIAAVPRATVVIANPTHYAVALRYIRGKDGAPLVVAKGIDLIAMRIREVAAAHGVPVIEDKPLARALYDAVDVDQWIPQEFYRAVAGILHALYTRQRHVHAR
jgi:flagellar biosynthetic protein FlhB